MIPTVLFIDDEPRLLEGIRRAMRTEKFRVLCVESVEAARTLMAAEGIDLVVCDENLYGTSGSDFMAEIRQSHPATMRMMLSGQTSIGAVVQAINAGEVFRVMIKPCSNSVMVETIMQGLAHKALMDQCRHALRMFKHQNDILQRLERAHPGILDSLYHEDPEISHADNDTLSTEDLATEIKEEIVRASGLHRALPGPDHV